MSATPEALLSESQQVELATGLHRQQLFGIHESPARYLELKSKRMSPHYLNIRDGISSYATRKLVAITMLSLAERRAHSFHNDETKFVYDHIAGTPEAMTSYAATMADLARISLLQPRVATNKGSGNKTPILGKYRPGDTVAVIDDVVTDGQSKIDTIDQLAANQLVARDYFVVLDRQEGGAPYVNEARKVHIVSALSVSGLVTILDAEGKLTRTQVDNVAEYIQMYGEPQAVDAMQELIR